MEKIDDMREGRIGTDRVTRTVLTIAVITVAFITFWFMMDLIIFAFILTFIFYHFQKIVEKGLRRARIMPFGNELPHWLTQIIVYVVGLAAMVFFVWEFTTVIVGQFQEIGYTLQGFKIESFKTSLDPNLVDFIDRIAGSGQDAMGGAADVAGATSAEGTPGTSNIDQYINSAIGQLGSSLLNILSSAGVTLLHFGMALIISFLILLERDNIKRFSAKVVESRIGFIYSYFLTFGGNFSHTFGKVMKVQVTIAFVNSVLSVIALTFIGLPNVLGLGVIIFALGLIPVAGVIISLIPLTIVAFNTGGAQNGLMMVVEVIVMIVVLHSVEAYVLNPKLMAQRTALPISLVFVILLVAEQYLKIWGLLIGVPLFIFLMSIFQVNYEEVCKQPPSKVAAKVRTFRDRRREEAGKR